MRSSSPYRWLMLGLFAISSLVTPAFAQVEMLLMVPGIEGSSRILPGGIDVEAFSFGMSSPPPILGGGGAGKVNMQDISISKKVDKATPKLMQSCASGQHLDEATLFVRRTKNVGTKEPVQDFLVYTLQDVLITSYSTGGSTGNDGLGVENCSLNFVKIKTSVLEDGKLGEFSWNLETNTAAAPAVE